MACTVRTTYRVRSGLDTLDSCVDSSVNGRLDAGAAWPSLRHLSVSDPLDTLFGSFLLFCYQGRTANDGANAVRVNHPVLKYLTAQLEWEGGLDPPNDLDVSLLVRPRLWDADGVLEGFVPLLDDRLD